MNKREAAKWLCWMSIASSCSGPGSRDGAMVFRYNESAGITSLDPAFARNPENIGAVNLIFNGLVEMDSNMKVKPSLADTWDISEDGLVYTFHLRRGVHFHPHKAFQRGKGRELTAMDFVYSFQRIVDPKVASPGAWIFANIDGDGNHGLGFEASGRDTFRIYLKKPFQPFLGLLTMKYCSAIPHEVVEETGAEFRRNPVGTGPFCFRTWAEGSKLVLIKNAKYFEKDEEGRSLPYLDAVSITFIGNEEVEYLEFLKGKLDFLSGSDGSNTEFIDHHGRLKLKYRNKIRKRNLPYLNTEYLGILSDTGMEAMKGNPLKNKIVRKALSMSIDRTSMIRFLRNGIGRPSKEGFIPRGMPPFDDGWVKGYSFNPDSAIKLLASAGYKGGKMPGVMVLYSTSQYLDLCEFITSQWAELGLNVRIELNPAATNRELTALGRLPFFRKSWVADYADAENYMALFYSPYHSPAGPNYTHFSDGEFDALYEKALSERSDSIRFSLYKRMEEIIIDECPVIPLYYDEVVWYLQPGVRGLSGNAMNLPDLRRVRTGVGS